MLISYEQLFEILLKYKLYIQGVLHVGAHDCEELELYRKLGIENENIYWVEALDYKVSEAKNRGINNIFQAVISDKDNQEIQFNISNNVQSSSILQFKTHSIEHPHVHFTETKTLLTSTIDTLVKRENIDVSKINMWNLDIQGVELLALKGGVNSLKYVRVLYVEVNEKELYEGCALLPELDLFLKIQGFVRVLTSMTPHGWGDAIYIKP